MLVRILCCLCGSVLLFLIQHGLCESCYLNVNMNNLPGIIQYDIENRSYLFWETTGYLIHDNIPEEQLFVEHTSPEKITIYSIIGNGLSNRNEEIHENGIVRVLAYYGEWLYYIKHCDNGCYTLNRRNTDGDTHTYNIPSLICSGFAYTCDPIRSYYINISINNDGCILYCDNIEPFVSFDLVFNESYSSVFCEDIHGNTTDVCYGESPLWHGWNSIYIIHGGYKRYIYDQQINSDERNELCTYYVESNVPYYWEDTCDIMTLRDETTITFLSYIGLTFGRRVAINYIYTNNGSNSKVTINIPNLSIRDNHAVYW